MLQPPQLSRTPRLVLLLVGLVVLLVIGGMLTPAVADRVRARIRGDWLESKHLALAPVIKGLEQPTYVAVLPDGSKRYVVLERAGLVRLASPDGHLDPTPLLDLSDDVSMDNEQGMFSLAFHPRFAENGYLYLAYSANDASNQVIRYTWAAGHVDPQSALAVLSLPKKSKVHNGGPLVFGPDGYLYVGLGDDESGDRAQLLDNFYGKILRLDVDSASPYAIPPDNPFVQTEGARGEIWSYGFRNPWRFSFDAVT